MFVERILGDAPYASASECAVWRLNEWWTIASTTDWLAGHPDCTPEEMFHRIVAMPEAGQNTMRGEVLLTAFMPQVVTATPAACTVISGDVASDDEVWNLVSTSSKWQRMIAFRMDSPRRWISVSALPLTLSLGR